MTEPKCKDECPNDASLTNAVEAANARLIAQYQAVLKENAILAKMVTRLEAELVDLREELQ
jgi:hypothetical protein